MVTVYLKADVRNSIAVSASDRTDFQTFDEHAEIQADRIAVNADFDIRIFQNLL